MGTPARPAQHKMWERWACWYWIRHLRSLTEHHQGAGVACTFAVAVDEASMGGAEACVERRRCYQIMKDLHALTLT